MAFTLEDARIMVEKGLSGLDLPDDPPELYEPIRYILNVGGKRLRPSLLLVACSLFSDKPQQALPAALAVEIFHNFTLLHDDIMDKAPLRRNQPTVHEKWNENVAILSGDVMSIYAYRLLAGIPSNRLKPVMKIFNQTATEVCEGQQMDMNFESASSVSVDDYLRMIRMKTAVLIASCLQMGAILGGSSVSDAGELYLFGLNLGIAFQLQDDWLDVFGNQDKFGKRIGGDILSDKKTFLLIKAMELAGGTTADELQSLLGNHRVKESEKIARVREIYRQLGISELTRELMNTYFRQALQHLDMVGIASGKRMILKKFAEDLVKREY